MQVHPNIGRSTQSIPVPAMLRKNTTIAPRGPNPATPQKPTTVSGRLANGFKMIDRFADKFSFRYPKNKERQVSFKGAILSLISYACLLYFTYSFYKRYTDSKNVETSVSQEVSKNTPKMMILESGFYPILSFVDDPLVDIPAHEVPKYYFVMGKVVRLEVDKANTDPNVSSHKEVVLDTFSYKPCSEVDSRYKDMLLNNSEVSKTYVKKFGICPEIKKPEMFYAEGNFYSPPRVHINIKILPCMLPDKTQCKSGRELSQVSFAITLPKVSLDPENEKNPISIVPHIRGFEFIDQDSKFKMDIRIKREEIWDDKSMLAEPKMVSEYHSVESRAYYNRMVMRHMYTCMSPDPPCDHYFEINLKGSDTVVKIKRSYVGILSTLGELGGVFDLTIAGVALCYMIFNFISCGERELESSFYDRGELAGAIKSAKRHLEPTDNFEGAFEQKSGNSDTSREIAEDEVVDSVFEDLLNGVDLIKTKMGAEFLITAFLGEEEKCLLPIFLAMRELRSRMGAKETTSGGPQPAEKVIAKDGALEIKSRHQTPKMSYKEALERLKNKEPTNEVERVVKRIFLEQIPSTLFDRRSNLELWADDSKKANPAQNLDLQRPQPVAAVQKSHIIRMGGRGRGEEDLIEEVQLDQMEVLEDKEEGYGSSNRNFSIAVKAPIQSRTPGSGGKGSGMKSGKRGFVSYNKLSRPGNR